MSRFISLCSQHSACSFLTKALKSLSDECEEQNVHEWDEVQVGKVIGKAEHVGCGSCDSLDALAMLSSVADYRTSDWDIQMQTYGYTALLLHRIMKAEPKLADSSNGKAIRDGVSQMGTPACDEGIEVVCDIEMAHVMASLQKASDMGYSDAALKLGVCYFEGDSVAQDKDMALELYQHAAELGNADAMYTLGLFLEDGIIVEKDCMIAFGLFQDAAEIGHAGAMFKLAEYYEYGLAGRGVPTDLDKSRKWYKQSADSGNDDAIKALKDGHPYLGLNVGLKRW